MALVFPQNPAVDFIYEDPTTGGQWQWDGEKWNVVPKPTRDTLEAPVVTAAALVKATPTDGNRFTSQIYELTATVSPDGDPASTKQARVKFTNPDGIIEARPETSAIESVQDTDFADGFEIEYVNDNSWSQIIWAGAPWNCYIAYGSGSSAEQYATSVDGKTWERHTYQVNYGNYQNGYFAYSEGNGLLYYLSSTGSNGTYYSTAVQTADDNFVWDQVPYSVTFPGSGAGGGGWWQGWGDLYRDEVNGRWYGCRTSSANGYSCSIMRGPANATLEGSWDDLISITGSVVGRIMVHQDGSITWSSQGKNQQGSYANGGTWWLPSPATSSTNIKIAHNGRNKIGRAMKVGTAGWAFPGTTDQNGDGLGRRLYWFSGDNPTDNCMQYHDLSNWAAYPDITSADLRDSLWIEDLGIGVVCGTATTDTRDSHGVVFVTTDAVNWTRIWTNEPGDDSQYKWERMFWNSDRAELVLVASTGTNPGGRVGYTQTVGQTVQFPELRFISAEGLAAFSEGMAITERNGDATGVIAALNVEGPSMVVKASSGTWDVGSRVQGPPTAYGDAYGVITGDGNVFGILPENGYTELDGNSPWQFEFPATFIDGSVPDTVLPADTTIEVEFKARSEVNGFVAESDMTTNQITPT